MSRSDDSGLSGGLTPPHRAWSPTTSGGVRPAIAAFAITPTVMLDNDASEVSTVVEASGRDRPGLLAALAKPISDAGLSILSAHIDGYGERAVDAFYVVDADGRKVTDAKQMSGLKAGLMQALEAAETPPGVKPRANLQKARASVAR